MLTSDVVSFEQPGPGSHFYILYLLMSKLKVRPFTASVYCYIPFFFLKKRCSVN